MVRFRDDDDDQHKLGRRPNKQDVERPTPGQSVAHPRKKGRVDCTDHDVK